MRNTDTISKKIILLNQTVLDSVNKDDAIIIKNFTELGKKILGADFGWVWWKNPEEDSYELAYKSANMPFRPIRPRDKAGNYMALKTKKPFFNTNVRREKYEFDLSQYMKSYVIIPICYGSKVYGTFDLCYKKKHSFTLDELALAQALGNAAAQSITIHRYLETDVLLTQEKIKNEFVANITHELRTPLAIMRGNIYLAEKGNSAKTVKSALKAIDEEIVHLSDLLSDLVLVTAGKEVEVKQIPIDLVKFIKATAGRLKNLAAENSIRIVVRAQKKAITLIADTEHMEKLFLNIIKNAITYGKSKIDIQIETNKNNALVRIADDGMGIAKEDLPYIFERFYRADKARTRAGKHSGLGLSIAKRMAEIHRGRIDVKSSPGKGSTFTVTLPLKQAK